MFGKKKTSPVMEQATPDLNVKANKTGRGTVNTDHKKRSSSEMKAMARTAQEVLQFDGITADGVLANGNTYSKIWHLIDSNFDTETGERQEQLLKAYVALLNRFTEQFNITIAIVNERNTKADLAAAYHIPAVEDTAENKQKNEYIADYNAMIDRKIEASHTEIVKHKYIMLTYRDNGAASAADKTQTSMQRGIQELALAEVSLGEGVKRINQKAGVRPVDGVERTALMHKIMNGISDEVPFEKQYSACFTERRISDTEVRQVLDPKTLKSQHLTIRDLVAPKMFAKSIQQIQLGENRFCKSFSLANLPNTLDTRFLTDITDFAYEMVTVIQLRPCPKKRANALVKNVNNSVKADVIKAMQTAQKNGYSPDLINEDLILQRDEAGQLRDDVLNKGKKLFFATMTATFFGQSEEDVTNITKLFASKCTNYSLNPAFLFGQQVDALNTALLVGNSKVTIDRLITSENARALLPFSVQELTDKKGHFYGVNAVSHNMIMYDRKRSKLANGLEFGISGSGKSFFIKGEIICNVLDGNDDMIILDPENEYHIVAEHFGGTVIDLALKGKWHINPCDLNMEWSDDGDGDELTDPLAEKCEYMVGLVESIYGKGRDCNIYETNCIHRATHRMYKNYIEEMTRRHREGCEEGQNDNIDTALCPTLYDFYKELVADGSAEGNKVSAAVESYCRPDGSYSIFAHHTNVPTDKRLLVYDMLYLPDKMMEMAMKVCLSDIWSKVVHNREVNDKLHLGKSIWIYLDEFHHFFKTQSSADTIKAYYKRVRKYGGIMTGITQDCADLLNNEAGAAMFNNTGFFVFLNQSPLGRDKLRDLYNISDNLIDYITDKPVGTGLIYNNTVMIPFDYKIPSDTLMYTVMSTNPHDKDKKKAIKKELNDSFAEEEGKQAKLKKQGGGGVGMNFNAILEQNVAAKKQAEESDSDFDDAAVLETNKVTVPVNNNGSDDGGDDDFTL